MPFIQSYESHGIFTIYYGNLENILHIKQVRQIHTVRKVARSKILKSLKVLIGRLPELQ